jgi:hypothetical protein
LAKTIGVLVLIGLVLGASVTGLAQDDRQAKEIIDAYKVWKLTDVLDLSEEDMPVFFSRVRKIGEAEEGHRREQREAVKEINDLLEAGASDSELESALREYEEMRFKHWEEIQSLRSEAASMLTVKQRCQYTVFEERFRNEIRKMINDVRSMRGGQPGARDTHGSGEGQGQRRGGSGGGRR